MATLLTSADVKRLKVALERGSSYTLPDSQFGTVSPVGSTGLSLSFANVLSNYTVTPGVAVVLANGTLTITLPNATGSGANLWIKNIGAGTVTIDAGAGKVIDGSQTALLKVQYEAVHLIDCDIGIWYVF